MSLKELKNIQFNVKILQDLALSIRDDYGSKSKLQIENELNNLIEKTETVVNDVNERVSCYEKNKFNQYLTYNEILTDKDKKAFERIEEIENLKRDYYRKKGAGIVLLTQLEKEIYDNRLQIIEENKWKTNAIAEEGLEEKKKIFIRSKIKPLVNEIHAIRSLCESRERDLYKSKNDEKFIENKKFLDVGKKDLNEKTKEFKETIKNYEKLCAKIALKNVFQKVKYE